MLQGWSASSWRERGYRSQGPVGLGASSWRKIMGTSANWEDPRVFVFPGEFNAECVCVHRIH